MKIAIYGGSFNPPHIGHVNAAKQVIEKIEIDKLLIIPDYKAPHKEMAPNTPDAQMRYEMCKLAFEDINGAIVCDIELQREGKSYTADTIALLRMQYPNDEFFLVIGTDMLLSFFKWYRFEQILNEVTLVVLSREEDDDDEINKCADELKEKYNAKIIHLDNEPIVVSSTQVRESLCDSKDTSFIQEQVLKYIKENHLYLGE